MTDIFLSYNEKDRETARRLAAMLESVGWTVWWDRRIPAGETWRSVLEDALENMRCMLVLWSSHSIESEWVYEEATEGRRLDKLVPVLIEAVRPPAGFREIQAADLTSWDGTREFEGMRMLIADLENMLGKPGATATEATPKRGAPGLSKSVFAEPSPAPGAERGRPYDPADLQGDAIPPLPRRNLMAWALAGALLLVAIVAYFYLSATDDTATPPQVTETPHRVPGGHTPSAAVAPVTPAAPERPSVTRATQESAARPVKEKPTKPAGTARPASARCADFLARIQLGETLSDDAQTAFRKECQQ
jgi:hypothetical protein